MVVPSDDFPRTVIHKSRWRRFAPLQLETVKGIENLATIVIRLNLNYIHISYL